MAGAGYKLFNTGDVLTAAQVNTYLQEQAVMRFANAAARTTALSGVLAEGMMSYLDDTNSVEVYNGSAWVSVGSTGDITGVTAGTGISGGGTSGDVTITNSMATAIDAKGDLIVGTGADTFSRLAVGTNGQQLVADSGEATGLKWQGFVGCRLELTANQSIPDSTDTTVLWGAETFDTSNFHSNSTNTERITIPTGLGGYYRVNIQLSFAVNGTGARSYYLYKNASTIIGYGGWGANSSIDALLNISNVYNLAAGDYIWVRVNQNSGAARNLVSPSYGTNFGVQWIGV